MSSRPREISRIAAHRHETFEDFAIEDAVGSFGGVVGHEAIDERICGDGNCGSGEWTVVEVGVFFDTFGESDGAELSEDVDVVVGRVVVGLQTVEFLELRYDEVGVGAVLVQVSAHG